MANLEKTHIDNKFIFTDEGRRMLTAQLNGIRFAVLGAILVQGIEPLDDKKPNGLDDDGHSTSPFYNAMRTIKLEDLIMKSGIVIGLKDVDYLAKGNERIEPSNLTEYENVLNEIEKHLLPLYYIPSQEIKDKFENVYGTYVFEFDRTSIAWDMNADVSFAHLCLIGKQYAETDDATFNVDKTQNPVIVGIAQLAGEYDKPTNTFVGGAQLLKEQNKYLATKIMLRFTLDENDFDINNCVDIESEEVQEVLGISKKFSLINNGLKNKNEEGAAVTMNIGGNKELIEELKLNDDGSLGTTKTVMVADVFNADRLDEQFNAGGLINVINKQSVDVTTQEYKPQIVLTTIENYESLAEPITLYNAKFELRGKSEKEYTARVINDYITAYEPGSGSSGSGSSGSGSSGGSGTSGSGHMLDDLTARGYRAPIFKMDSLPEYAAFSDTGYAIEIFGQENNILGLSNIDKLIFSKNNITVSPLDITEETLNDRDGNVLFNSNYNFFNTNEANGDNVLINSDYNVISGSSVSNMLLGADANYISNGAAGNVLLGTNFNNITGGIADSNVIIGGSKNYIHNSYNVIMLSHEGLLAESTSNQLLLGKYNLSRNAGIIYGIGTDDNNRKNALEFYPNNGELVLYKNNVETVRLGGEHGVKLPAGNGFSVDLLSANNIWTQKIKIAPSKNASEHITFSYLNKAGKIYPTMEMANDNKEFFKYNADGIYFGYLDKSDGTQMYFGSESTVSSNGQSTMVFYDHAEAMQGSDNVYIGINAASTDPYSPPTPYKGTMEIATSGPNLGGTHRMLLDSTGISLYEESNTGGWKLVNTIDKNTGVIKYNKITVDVYMWGGLEDFHCGILNIRGGTSEQRSWVENFFNKTPPFFVCDNDNANPKRDIMRIVYGDGANYYNKLYTDMTEADWSLYNNLLASTKSRIVVMKKDSTDDDPSDDDMIPAIYTLLPDGIDELEVFVFAHDFVRNGNKGYDHAVTWVPLVKDASTYFSNSPRIKIHYHIPFDEGNGTEDIWFFTNRNYNQTGDPILKKYVANENGSVNMYCSPTYAANPYGSFTPDTTSEGSHVWGWWKE